jgi:ketosteroid isomerase-like protein
VDSYPREAQQASAVTGLSPPPPRAGSPTNGSNTGRPARRRLLRYAKRWDHCPPMSRNAEIVRQALEANRSGDIEGSIERLVALSDPDVEFKSVTSTLEPHTYRGAEGLRRYMGDMANSWAEWHLDTEEVFEAGSDTVVAVFRSYLIGRESGVAIEAQRGSVFVLSEGKILRGQVYTSRDEALEAAGLRQAKP